MNVKRISINATKENDVVIVHFKGGHFELTNCGEGVMWAHISLDHDFVETTDGRFDSDGFHKSFEDGHVVKSIPECEKVSHVALKFKKNSA